MQTFVKIRRKGARGTLLVSVSQQEVSEILPELFYIGIELTLMLRTLRKDEAAEVGTS